MEDWYQQKNTLHTGKQKYEPYKSRPNLIGYLFTKDILLFASRLGSGFCYGGGVDTRQRQFHLSDGAPPEVELQCDFVLQRASSLEQQAGKRLHHHSQKLDRRNERLKVPELVKEKDIIARQKIANSVKANEIQNLVETSEAKA
ncbi:MAG: hypothetical protein L6R37_008257 [Teloschistes peruensis]|nr:MAG: hypothetical protein L6R37_008257 [Teloschistes peruensis]